MSFMLRRNTSQKKYGFTIVELLIVIVVIAILAAISVVAYNGIQDRANDAAIVSDLSNLSKKYELFKIDSPQNLYPFGDSQFAQLNISIGNKDAYDTVNTVTYNLLNCTNSNTYGKDYAILALSKSGKKLYISSTSGGVKEYNGSESWVQLSSCALVLPGSTGFGTGYQHSAWRSWTH